MKKLLTASVLIIGTACSAYAADLRPAVKAPMAPLAPPPPSWTGCYVDAGYGYGMWNQDQNSETYPGLVSETPSTTTGGRGYLGRVGGGCDYEFASRWVIGAFGDYDFMNIHGTLSDALIDSGDTSQEQGNEKESHAWGIGGRIGYAITPDFLTYFDAGYTQARFDQVNMVFSATGGTASDYYPAHTYHGWFIGGGTEYALNFSWLPIHGLFWRNEYRYATYQAADIQEIGLSAGPEDEAIHARKYVQTITSSLVWRFNWP